MWISTFLLLTSAYLYQAETAAPSYIKYCARSDTNFNECALQRAKEAFPHIMEGDPKYNIRPLDPFHLEELVLAERGSRQVGFSLKIKNAKGVGLKNGTVENINFDFEKKHIHTELYVPNLQILGKYEISGNILLFPVNGKGDINITLVNSKIVADHDYTLESKEGNRYMTLKNPKSRVTPTRMYIYPERLFKGNNQVEKQLVVFLNENWRDIYHEVSPAVIKVFSNAITSVYNSYQRAVPFDVYFPEKLP